MSLFLFTCVFFLRSKKRKLILNVSDLWPIAGLELGALKKNFSYRILENIEQFNYKNADLILGQSEEILTHIISIFPNKATFLYRNFPDFEVPEVSSENTSTKKLKIVYAGLLGVAQGIYKLCKALDYTNVQLHIYGAGAEQNAIEDHIKKHPNLDIVYHGEVSRNALHKALIQYDITIIPLLNRIYGSVPSKIFEYARLGIPMLYFGGGEGEKIIEQYNLGWIAEAGNYSDLNAVISRIESSEIQINYRDKIKETAIKNFDFNIQLMSLFEKL